jgi:hypothetical protein
MREETLLLGARDAVNALSALLWLSTSRNQARASSVSARGSTAPRAASADAGTRRVPCKTTKPSLAGLSGVGAASVEDATRETTVRA